jgi:hypothetical protein
VTCENWPWLTRDAERTRFRSVFLSILRMFLSSRIRPPTRGCSSIHLGVSVPSRIDLFQMEVVAIDGQFATRREVHSTIQKATGSFSLRTAAVPTGRAAQFVRPTRCPRREFLVRYRPDPYRSGPALRRSVLRDAFSGEAILFQNFSFHLSIAFALAIPPSMRHQAADRT